ncbi:MAG: ABC transporter permease subunit, partial [Spirochaetaceae bacterium]|nr:ABC transporter permease subunit [Spirochaetaceae bacterium]
MQRFVDAWMAFPGLLLLLTIMSIAGRGLSQIIVVLGIASGVGGLRVVRGAVVATKGNDYFLAAKAVGAPTGQVLVRHVLPNIVAPRSIAPPLAFFGFAAPPCRPVRVWPTGNPRVTLGRVRSEIQRRCGVRVRTQKAVAWSDRAGRWAV